MVTVYDVEQGSLVAKVAEKLKADKDCKIPEWAYHVKTGSGRMRVPEDPEWWYMRLASILRQVYRHPQVGVVKLKTYYGGRMNRGHAPERRRDAGGKVIRACLQQLVELGLLEKGSLKGRVVSSKGHALLDNTAYELAPKKSVVASVSKTKDKKSSGKKEDSDKKKDKESKQAEKTEKDAKPQDKKPEQDFKDEKKVSEVSKKK